IFSLINNSCFFHFIMHNGCKMNLSIKEVDGEVLCVSQFTLMADYKKGNRPSFITAARPDLAVPMFEYFKSEMAKYGIRYFWGGYESELN
ncbi:D-aminoacyl-tRNA deacylase, partial [Riemerella anatipestifer]